MNNKQLGEKLKPGDQFRRKSWSSEKILTVNEDGSIDISQLSYNDMYAEDWEILENVVYIKKTNSFLIGGPNYKCTRSGYISCMKDEADFILIPIEKKS
jgi:hypothetical protein